MVCIGSVLGYGVSVCWFVMVRFRGADGSERGEPAQRVHASDTGTPTGAEPFPGSARPEGPLSERRPAGTHHLLRRRPQEAAQGNRGLTDNHPLDTHTHTHTHTHSYPHAHFLSQTHTLVVSPGLCLILVRIPMSVKLVLGSTRNMNCNTLLFKDN